MLEDGNAIAARIATIDDRPTTIILSTEVLAPSLYSGFQQHGLKPGKDIAIIGFRDNPRARYLTPSLTCHSFSLTDLGQVLTETLLAGMPAFARFYADKASNKIWPLSLVPGESDDFTL